MATEYLIYLTAVFYYSISIMILTCYSVQLSVLMNRPGLFWPLETSIEEKGLKLCLLKASVAYFCRTVDIQLVQALIIVEWTVDLQAHTSSRPSIYYLNMQVSRVAIILAIPVHVISCNLHSNLQAMMQCNDEFQ